jgi:hypothetical protein
MQYYSVWPGAYSFKSELKSLLESFKDYIETVLRKIEETEKKL